MPLTEQGKKALGLDVKPEEKKEEVKVEVKEPEKEQKETIFRRRRRRK